MKKVMASLLTMGIFLSAAVAQNNPNLSRSATGVQPATQTQAQHKKHKTPDEWVSELDAVVNLSAEQKLQAKNLAVETETKMKSLRDEAKKGADKEAMKQKRMQIHKEKKAALDKILNDEQKAKWKAHREAMHSKHTGNAAHHYRSAEQQVSDLDAIVGLTAEQKVKVKTLAETKNAKMKALHEEQKASPNDEAFKQKKQAIRQEFKAGLDRILTAEQQAKLKAHRESMKKQKGTPAR